jgi:hypothetical protein
MDRIRFRARVTPEDALNEGISYAGTFTLEPTDEQFRSLSAEEKAVALPYATVKSTPAHPRAYLRVKAPTWPGFVEAIRARLEQAAKEERERAAKAEAEKKNAAEIRALIEMHGSTSDWLRYEAGTITEEEVRKIALRVWLPALPIPRFQPIEHEELEHENDCADDEQVKFRTESLPWPSPCSPEAVERREAILAASPGAALVDLVEHIGWCETCDRETKRRAWRVTLRKAGLRLVREYELTPMQKETDRHG